METGGNGEKQRGEPRAGTVLPVACCDGLEKAPLLECVRDLGTVLVSIHTFRAFIFVTPCAGLFFHQFDLSPGRTGRQEECSSETEVLCSCLAAQKERERTTAAYTHADTTMDFGGGQPNYLDAGNHGVPSNGNGSVGGMGGMGVPGGLPQSMHPGNAQAHQMGQQASHTDNSASSLQEQLSEFWEQQKEEIEALCRDEKKSE